ncbi:unnamed protein product [Symbiodinium microadriaticum]|nr:unnamed protein product [Symbiodinium sp. KB8]CAE7577355.1 unnamed protein product [Symbiodinium microadriaticum]
MEAKPTPFRIHVPDEELADLKDRLARARIVPDEILDRGADPSGAWSYGTDRTVLSEYVSHWLHKYDWRQKEAELNALPHFRLEVGGLQTHFIHQRSSKSDAIPLLLVHGWPGSIVEFLKLLPLLADKFHVVAPSIPGYGWSEAPKERGADVVFMADHMAELMQKLGYDSYVAQGGDWGAIITSLVAQRYPQQCVALHINMCVAMPGDWYDLVKVLLACPFWSSEEWAGIRSTIYFQKYETAYQKIQGTKPQSLGYGLNDSPVGLLAWILEKFQSWSDSRGGRPEASGLTMDEILTNVMVYWTTQSITSSLRLYYETLKDHPPPKVKKDSQPRLRQISVQVPTAVLWAHYDLYKLPRSVAALCYNIRQWTKPSKGGHFFAFEQPELIAADIERFFCQTLDFEHCKKHAPLPGLPVRPGKYILLAIVADAAREAADAAMAISDGQQDKALEAKVHLTVSRINLRLNDPESAVQEVREAIAIYQQTGEGRKEAAAFYELAGVCMEYGNLNEGHQAADKAQGLWQNEADKKEEIKAKLRLAELVAMKGQIEEAIQIAEEAPLSAALKDHGTQ